jgi:hypothetical protein
MRRAFIGAAALAGVLALAGVAAAVGGSPSAERASAAGLPLVEIHFEFRVEERATHYTVVNTGNARGTVDLANATYAWKVAPPDNDPTCNNRGVLTGTGKEFVWRHGNKGDPISDDACNHDIGLPGIGHPGDVDVDVKDARWSCTAGYTGTQAADGSPTGDGPAGDCTNIAPPPTKARDCDEERAALAAAKAKEDALARAIADLRLRWKEYGRQLDEVNDELNAARSSLSGFAVDYVKFVVPFLDHALDKLAELRKVGVELDAAFKKLGKADAAAAAARRHAEKALAACLDGKPRQAQAARREADCRAQRIAAAKAQALLSVYQSVSRSVGRVGLAGARTKLLDARKLMARAQSVSGGGAAEMKLDKRIASAATAAGRAADALARLIAANARLSANVNPARQEVAKATAALAACEK